MISIDRYERFRPIGSGGFSQVYEAAQPEFNRKVAVKVLTIGTGQSLDREMFERECRAMGAVSSHPNIVTVYDSGFTDQGLPYIAMELYHETLLDRIKSSGHLPLAQVLDVGVQMCAALKRAHDEQILHRDIKPQNIFFSAYDDPALADFGIASLADDGSSQHAAGLTIHYAPPEVIDGAAPTVESDIYSLGATLYTALAGHRPFAKPGRDSQTALTNRILTEAPPPVTAQNIPSYAERILNGLLAKHPNDRPRSALEVGMVLRDLQERLGLPPTPMRLVTVDLDADVTVTRDRGASPSLLTDATDTTSSVTIARTKSTDRSTDDFREEEGSPRSLVAVIALVALLCMVGVGTLIALGGDDGGQQAQASPLTLPGTTTVLNLTPPDSIGPVSFDETQGGVLISWEPVESARSYRLSFTTDSRESVRVTNPEYELAEAENTCLSIRVEGEAGVLSEARQVCVP